MKRAFSLVEILVLVTILAVISGGALVYLNSFNSQQKLNKGRDEVVLAIKLAQSYAKTRQLPVGSDETELRYVQLQIKDGNLVAGANGIGSTYFSIRIGNEGIGVSISPQVIYFWAGNGFWVKDELGTLNSNNEKAEVTIEQKNIIISQEKIEINSLGQIQ
ncbi:MAG: hypothetical protein US68_C0006G0015 [Candidatus Shapirobacteria bacterium GW2011_GWE1_38_10]|uniref:Prepilin-type N-terminal cleavage/methylation domain-containing protein n=1 Tax=Candidatus Shapirobacteria bacterium GW2011_GWE1_38_10 TaxID=1618488 RepID=A0A0G0IH57_9BACT|nr:MAG: hypothetical protein US46_C0001G0061 [Candidatus Shapirobacteria bacterium GW2011_GWF2_37_20]KKQ50335.1 MAG: hypothetical protein US68_C0006G0015 [Candidatus Shapirobacteria bacterium GW2011_GWE1_38_10]KKQ65158.1 MAG: hypothetical protein US85_C0001G0085 [Candidatus Shapirobacteria bacterium GW2011_GWF1_38_23]HBP50949.1 hypothetical protein [Candidatus Shapirobacteria bacterium]